MTKAAVTSLGSVSFPFVALLMLGNGAALLIAILFGVALRSALIAFLVIAVPLGFWRIHQLSPALRTRLARRVNAGLRIGIFATASYDASRWLLVHLLSLNLNPFGAFLLFGWGIGGHHLSHSAAFIVGAIYHIVNGLCFSVAYCLFLGGRPWPWGVVWALSLELAMLTVYPGWLHLQAVMGEFTVMSVTGHLAYGATLGWLSERSSLKPGLQGLLS